MILFGTTFKLVHLPVKSIQKSNNQAIEKLKSLHFFGTKWDSLGHALGQCKSISGLSILRIPRDLGG